MLYVLGSLCCQISQSCQRNSGQGSQYSGKPQVLCSGILCKHKKTDKTYTYNGQRKLWNSLHMNDSNIPSNTLIL